MICMLIPCLRDRDLKSCVADVAYITTMPSLSDIVTNDAADVTAPRTADAQSFAFERKHVYQFATYLLA